MTEINEWNKESIERHKQEEIQVLNYIQNNNGEISGLMAREHISVIRRLWCQNLLVPVGDYHWQLVK